MYCNCMLNTFLVICPYSSVSALHQNSHLNYSLISCQGCENGWLVENVVSFVLGMVKEDKENKILIKFLHIFNEVSLQHCLKNMGSTC